MNEPRTSTPGNTIIERFQQIDRVDFPREVDRLWAAASRLKNTVADEVRQGNIPVMTGLAITSCVAATSLGYESFHGEPSSTDLLTALGSQQRQPRNRQRQQEQQQYDFSS